MYQNHSISQQDVCLICLSSISKSSSFHQLFSRHCICSSCLSLFKRIDIKTCFEGYPLRILYGYNDFFRTLLFRYKGQYDYALKDAFLDMYKRELQRRYKDYLIVVAPSASKANDVRGFAPNQAIAMTIHSHVFNGLYKKVDYKQSDQSYTQRAGIRDVIGLRGGSFLENRKILLLDDVMTSGETIKTCLRLIEKENPQKIEILILAMKEKYLVNLGIIKQARSI